MVNSIFCQARMIGTQQPYVVMDAGPSDNGVFLVVENPNNNALMPPAGVPGNANYFRIVSEDENNIVRWFIGSGTGNHQVPFSSTTGTSVRTYFTLPAGCQGTSAGNSYVDFATYRTASSNNAPFPSDVNHLTNLNTATASPGTQANDANALNTIDRFWIIDATGYTTNPCPNLFFAYDANDGQVPNTITTNALMIQRFNPTAGTQGQWADYLFPSVSLSNTNLVGPAPVPSDELYRSWTISSFNEPLSVDLLSFEAFCEDDRALIKWSTASEQNSDYFAIERSTDGEYWETIGEVQAAENSNSIVEYSFYDENAKNGINYYKVTEFDANGMETEFGPVSASCGSNVFEIVNVNNDYSTNGQLDIIVNTSEDKRTDIRILDMAGKLVFEQANEIIQEGVSTITLSKGDLSMGVYFIAIQSADELLTKKVVLN